MRQDWNEAWFFSEVFTESLLSSGDASVGMTPVRLPHSVVETPFNYFSELSYQKVAGYKKVFYAPTEWREKSLRLTFEGVAHKATVYLNGKSIQTHVGGYTAFTVVLDDYLVYGAQNALVVKVDSRETLNCPPFGYVVDYMTYGGIYREVYLDVLEKAHIQDVFFYSKSILTGQRTLVVQTTLSTEAMANLDAYTLHYALLDKDNNEVLQTVCGCDLLKSVAQIKGEEGLLYEMSLPEVRLWDVSDPYLYQLKVSLVKVTISGTLESVSDEKQVTCGFRETYFDARGFWLNGNLLKLRGLNRHQSYPYVGYAMPKRPQVVDAQIMKNELGLNAVRTAHYPQSKHFIEVCDALGLLVFTEMPGWQHIGDEAWKEEALVQVEEMVRQYRNHPSIFIWGVRINESADDHEFYKRTNALAKRLDPSRQTGGVRCIKYSELLEDVYTYNDFSHNGTTKGIASKNSVTKEANKAYLVTEYNGHMFPTKSFDDEAHRTEHARRHAVVLEGIAADEQVAGGFGWCLFDYNTHQDFGSGDRICHHGVLDMFRNHKLAAAVYSSQGESVPVLSLSSDMAIGDFPEGGIGKVYAFSNADFIDLYKNEAFVKRFEPDRKTFGHLPHPPFVIDDVIGELMEKQEGFSFRKSEAIKAVLMAVSMYGTSRLPLKFKLKALGLILFRGMTFSKAQQLYYDYVGNWGAKATTYRFDAIKDSKVVKSVHKGPMQDLGLSVSVDTTHLVEESTYDVASVRVMATNEHGQVLAYCLEPLELRVEGMIELIGPSVVPMRGGMCGTYVKSVGESGKGILYMTCRGVQKTIEFTVDVNNRGIL
uniref:Beta-galactosidase n=1 Tax=uncultured organism TaxID=155900 RepID=A0A060DF43_9ZZZZ|nr:beta-galactosidase [uncultured organism]